MRTIKSTILGIGAGALSIIVSLSLVCGGWVLLSGQLAELGKIIPVGLLHGLLLSGLSITLYPLVKGYEYRVVGVLVSIALAATFVLVGQFPNGSPVPVALYALALLNGLIAPPVTAGLSQRNNISFR